MNEQGWPPSDPRNADDVDASSTASSEEDAEKLSVVSEKNCSDEEVSIAADDADQTEPAVTITQQDGTASLIGEKSHQTVVKDATESNLEKPDSVVTDGRVQSQQQQEEQYGSEIIAETDVSDIVVVDDEITFKKRRRRVERNWLIYVR